MIEAFLQLWYLWLLVLIVFVFWLYKAKIKGIIGEKTISVFLSRLDPTKYKVINDLMLRTEGKTSQIDQSHDAAIRKELMIKGQRLCLR